MKYYSTLAILLALAFSPESTAFADETNAVLRQVATNLQTAWAALNSTPVCDFAGAADDGGILLVSYPAANSTPALSIADLTNTARLSPATNGFILKVELERLGAGNAVATPSTNSEISRETVYNCTPVGGTPHQIFWTLSYGPQMDKAVVDQLKQNLWRQGFAPANPAATPNTAERTPAMIAPTGLQVK